MATAFLTAHWRHMAVLNFEVDPELLRWRLPTGVELDLFEDRALVSVVGFMFSDARIWGVSVPLHREFEEVNLRYYTRRQSAHGIRRGVTFIKEIVPLWAVVQTARWVYKENFSQLPMRHEIDLDDDQNSLRDGGVVQYGWKIGPRWYRMRTRINGCAFRPPPDSEAGFVIDHWYAHARHDQNGCVEYYVEHPPWRIWNVTDVEFATDVSALYGAEFKAALHTPPCSAFVSEASRVNVFSRKYVAAKMPLETMPGRQVEVPAHECL